jgi:hypothetical protein
VYLLLPYWALLWLTFAVATGDGVAIAPLILTASLLVQTHLSYLYQTIVLVVVGLASYAAVARVRRRAAQATRHLLAGLTVGLLCWAQPLWDQFAGEGNLATVLGRRGEGARVGWNGGAELIASSVLLPPRFWLPGSMWDLSSRPDFAAIPTAWVVLFVWLLLLSASAIVALRSGRGRVAALSGSAIAALVAATVAAAMIPTSVFGRIVQNYFWMWPTGAFVTTALLINIVAASAVVGRWLRSASGVIAVCFTAFVIGLFATRTVDHFAPVTSVATAGERVARPVVDALRVWLPLHDVTGPLLVDYSRASFGTYVRYTILAELQRAGIDFVFPPGDENLRRFGAHRCASGAELTRLVLADSGGDPRAGHGDVVVAQIDAFGDADRAELEAFDATFGDRLRDGSVTVDTDLLEFLSGRTWHALRRVLSSPGMPATGLAGSLAPWIASDALDVPQDVDDDFDRWVDLELRSRRDEVTILLAPPSGSAAAVAACTN